MGIHWRNYPAASQRQGCAINTESKPRDTNVCEESMAGGSMGNGLVYESASTPQNYVMWRILTRDSQRLQSVPGLAHTHVFAKPKMAPVTGKTTDDIDESPSQQTALLSIRVVRVIRVPDFCDQRISSYGKQMKRSSPCVHRCILMRLCGIRRRSIAIQCHCSQEVRDTVVFLNPVLHQVLQCGRT